MRLTSIEAENFLSFGSFKLPIFTPHTIITGPNGAGKSNTIRCLDLAQALLRRATGGGSERLGLYSETGRDEAAGFTVTLGLELDQQWERDLVQAFVHVAAVSLSRQDPGRSAQLDVLLRGRLDKHTIGPLCQGMLRIQHASTLLDPWLMTWEFGAGQRTWHIVLEGDGQYQLRFGTAAETSPTTMSQTLPMLFGLDAWDGQSRLEDEFSFLDVLPTDRDRDLHLVARLQRDQVMPLSTLELAKALGLGADDRTVSFANILQAVLHRSLVLTDNRRVPVRRIFELAELAGPIDLRDGGGVAGEVYRLKNGRRADTQRYEEIAGAFLRLTGRRLDVRSRPDGESRIMIEPVVIDGEVERLVELEGAGIQEALVLCALLAGETGRVIVLDEPAINLGPVVQRQVVHEFRRYQQLIVVTHSADLVPVEEATDLGAVVRLRLGPQGTEVYRVGRLAADKAARWDQILQIAHVRALLFTAGVILCEGSTEVGALRRWLRQAATARGLPSPDDAHIALVDVGGDSSFGTYIEYLTAFGIRWVIIADGPALHRNGNLYKQLRRMDALPPGEPATEEFENWRSYWQEAGVFSVADRFGKDGSKAGEFEAYLQRRNPSVFDEAQAQFRKSKVLVGSYFASKVECPTEIAALYAAMQKRLTR